MKKKEIRRRRRIEIWDMAKDVAKELDELKTELRKILPVKLLHGSLIVPQEDQRNKIAIVADQSREPEGTDIHYLDGRAYKLYPEYRAEIETHEGEQYIIFFKRGQDET